jgi:hypothetical protein
VKKINVEINSDQALVIFEFLAELDDGNRAISGVLAAELRALAGLQAALERILLQPFEDKYAELLADARARIEADGT